MKILNRATLACLLASTSLLLASCSGGSGYSGPPSVLNPNATATPTIAPVATATPNATATPSAAATATPSAAATATPSAAPTAAPSAGATATPSAAPVATPTAVATATPAATAAPTTAATATPVATPTAASTASTMAVCPPTTIPAPVSTTTAFPTGNGGTITNPAYYDTSGSTTFPANNAAAGTSITIKIGGTNYDSFPSPATSGATVLAYIEASTTSAQAITFSGTNPAVVIVATSPSCFSSAHKYSIDTDVSGLTLNTSVGTASNNGMTQTFSVTTAAKQFPTGTVQQEIYISG